MKYFTITLITLLLTLLSCSKNENSTTSTKETSTKPKTVSKHKDMKPQEEPPREIVDAEAEKYTIQAVLEIDKEIPILELISKKSWTQEDLNQISQMQAVDTIRLEGMDLDKVNFDFLKTIKTLKKVSTKNSKISPESITSLKNILKNVEILQ